jgi:SEC-C motif
MAGPGRNERCRCGSGLKAKRCCGTPRGPSAEELERAFVADQGARVLSQVLEASLAHGPQELFADMLDLPARYYQLQLRLPPVLPPELEQLRAAMRTDNQERFDELISSAVATVDTPSTRAGLARELLSLMNTEDIHPCAAATAVFDLTRSESSFLEAALIEALAVSAGTTTTPSGLLVAAR